MSEAGMDGMAWEQHRDGAAPLESLTFASTPPSVRSVRSVQLANITWLAAEAAVWLVRGSPSALERSPHITTSEKLPQQHRDDRRRWSHDNDISAARLCSEMPGARCSAPTRTSVAPYVSIMLVETSSWSLVALHFEMSAFGHAGLPVCRNEQAKNGRSISSTALEDWRRDKY
jgi:hypothetical protein